MDAYWTVEVLKGRTWTRAAGPFTDARAAERARADVLRRLRAGDDKDRPSHIRVRRTENGRTVTDGREQYV